MTDGLGIAHAVQLSSGQFGHRPHVAIRNNVVNGGCPKRTEINPSHKASPQTHLSLIYTRLQSHASGRRSGDQFCVYVADCLVLPSLSAEDISAITSGRHQMDAYVRRYIHENLLYRFVMLPDAAAAYEIEAVIKDGGWAYGRPLLSPGK